MTPASIVRGAQADGLALALTPHGTIKVAGDRVVLDRWAPIIRGSKAAVIEVLSRHTEPMTADQEAAVRAWLAHIHETDPAAIADVLERCQRDPRARAYVLERASEIPAPAPPRMVCCGACKHFERTSYHPNLGHCAQSQPEPPAGLCDTDLRRCDRFSRRGAGG